VANINDQDLKIYQKVLSKTTKLDDILLSQLTNYFQLNNFIEFPETEKAIELFDFYTRGEYAKCLEIIPVEIFRRPHLIELYDLYVKSNIELSTDFNSH
jgi:hypothetical protein